MTPHRFTTEQELLIAALASADPRTVRKALRGAQIRGSVGARIWKAIETLAEVEAHTKPPYEES
jgi:hypothetical protein